MIKNTLLNKENLFRLIVIIATIYFVSFCKSNELYESKSVESNSDLLAGRASFERNCVSCHGEKGRGDGIAGKLLKPNPIDFKSPANRWKNGNTLESVEHTLFVGIKGTLQVSYKHLGEREVKQLAKYVIYLSKN